MIIKDYYVIGVMSGTSLDGLDLVYIKLQYNNNAWTFVIINSITINYNPFWRNTLSNLVDLKKEELIEIDIDYTRLLAEEINKFILNFNIKKIDIISSHGHTAQHNPDNGFTYQIGNREELAKLISKKVVCDFRVQDVEYGGQGAPLVPIGDKLLFSEYNFCVNLGGFANVSLEIDSERVAYDICPVNIVLNHYTRKINLEYDPEGEISKKGKINQALLTSLNNLNFYKLNYPKSLGLEWVNLNVIPLIDSFKLLIEDVLRTFIEHVAIQIGNEINKKNN